MLRAWPTNIITTIIIIIIIIIILPHPAQAAAAGARGAAPLRAWTRPRGLRGTRARAAARVAAGRPTGR